MKKALATIFGIVVLGSVSVATNDLALGPTTPSGTLQGSADKSIAIKGTLDVDTKQVSEHELNKKITLDANIALEKKGDLDMHWQHPISQNESQPESSEKK